MPLAEDDQRPREIAGADREADARHGVDDVEEHGNAAEREADRVDREAYRDADDDCASGEGAKQRVTDAVNRGHDR